MHFLSCAAVSEVFPELGSQVWEAALEGEIEVLPSLAFSGIGFFGVGYGDSSSALEVIQVLH